MRKSNIIYFTLLMAFLQSHSVTSANELAKNKLAISTVQDQNKIVARRIYEEGLSKGIFRVPYTEDFLGHGGGTNTFTHEEGINEAKGWRVAFPDLKVEVDLILAEDDLVSVRWTARGVNSQAGMGIPATGKQVQTSGTTVFRFVNGAIAEEWTAGDALGLLRQLGLMPGVTKKLEAGE